MTDKEADLASLMKFDAVELGERAVRDEAAIEPISSMQQAVLDGSAHEVEGVVVLTFLTNVGTVFLASPADIERQTLMDGWASARFSRMRKVDDAEIDRLMKEDRD